jgi:lysophospholipase L1-like esterase
VTVNFGHSARTLLKKGDYPYWKSPQYKKAIAFNPDVVIIKLGTNDTKPKNWAHEDEFIADYKAMINQFKSLPSHPRIWICYPVPAYPERWGIKDSIIKNEVIPKIDEIARETGVEIIKLYEPLSGKPELFPDKIHPNAEGAKLMSEEIYHALTGKKYLK